MKKIILLYKHFGNNIFTRSAIIEFFDEIKKQKTKEITIDFKNIDFISRSCADEYLKRKEKSNKIISEKNMQEQICFMFKAVKNQYEKAGITISFNIPSDKCCIVSA